MGTNGDFYVALGSSMCLALLVWVGGGLLKRVLYFFGNEPSLGRKSPIRHMPRNPWLYILPRCTGFYKGSQRTLTMFVKSCGTPLSTH